jgi:hypothetical protein
VEQLHGQLLELAKSQNKSAEALATYNNDVAEYWEWSGQGRFPVDTTNDAYKLGVNYIIYALTH